jgi:hypothetical protein
MFNIDNYKKYIFLFFLLIIFFLYGLVLSEIIDYIFNEHNPDIEDYKIALEIIGEIGVAYLIYFSLGKYSEKIIINFFNIISIKPPGYLNQLLLFAFSTGIFKNLEKSTKKINYFRNKIKIF